MAATDAPLDRLKELIGTGRCPYQQYQFTETGRRERHHRGRQSVRKQPQGEGIPVHLLRVSMAFHSPIMRVIHDELEAYVASIPFHSPRIPVISNTTRAPYPSDPDEIRRILMAHLESNVHWMENVRTLWNDYGIRHFVEVGPATS